MNKKHLYHQEVLNDWDYSEDNWAETDDVQFADVGDFDDLEIALFMLPDDIYHSVGDDIFQQSEMEGNDLQ